jgi:hypothetical protein
MYWGGTYKTYESPSKTGLLADRAWGFVRNSKVSLTTSLALSAASSLIRKNMSTITTLGGLIKCNQCQAKSKRSQQQCRGPAIRGKSVCRMHGGSGSGPKTEAGRQRCAAAKTIHGFDTRQARTERALGMRRLRELENLGHLLGIMSGPRTLGRKPGAA